MTEYIDKTEAMRRFKPFGREIPKEQVMAVLASIKEGVVRCEKCKFNKKCTLQHYWTVDGFTEEIEYCSLGKRSEW